MVSRPEVESGAGKITEHSSSLTPIEALDVLNPEEFGLAIDIEKTIFLWDYCNRPEAIVISRESILANHEGYQLYQRALLLNIAKDQGIDVERERETLKTMRLPKIISTLNPELRDRATQVFYDHERHYKKEYDILWLLLDETIQEEFFRRLPYIDIPPYYNDNGTLRPLSHKVWYSTDFPPLSEETFDPSLLPYHNPLPYLNEVTPIIPGFSRAKVRLVQSLSIPGQLIASLVESGGRCHIVHALARRTLSYWGLLEKPLDPRDYAISHPFRDVTSDVDIAVYGPLKQYLGIIIHRVGKELSRSARKYMKWSDFGAGFFGALMFGLSMSEGIRYGILLKPMKRRADSLNPWSAANSIKCIAQSIIAWAGRETAVPTNLLIQTMSAVSQLRSLNILPELLTIKGGTRAFATKAPDVFDALDEYAEAGGGIKTLDGQRRNIVRFASTADAFPDNSMQSWHIIRTVNDLLGIYGGVLFPSGARSEKEVEQDNAQDLSRQGAAEFRDIVVSAAGRVGDITTKLRSSKRDMHLLDLRMELSHGATEAMNKDLYNFLVLCSGPEITNSMRGLEGIELSRLFPHIGALRKDSRIWSQILERIKLLEQTHDSLNVQDFCRCIWEIPEVRTLIGQHLEQEFIRDPVSVGSKLMIPTSVRDRMSRGWCHLHPLMGPYALRKEPWKALLTYIEQHPHESWTNWSDVLKFIRDAKKVYWKSTQHFVEGKLIPKWKTWIQTGDPNFLDKQLRALADWIVDPGF